LLHHLLPSQLFLPLVDVLSTPNFSHKTMSRACIQRGHEIGRSALHDAVLRADLSEVQRLMNVSCSSLADLGSTAFDTLNCTCTKLNTKLYSALPNVEEQKDLGAPDRALSAMPQLTAYQCRPSTTSGTSDRTTRIAHTFSDA
jgi:hypothetical protein